MQCKLCTVQGRMRHGIRGWLSCSHDHLFFDSLLCHPSMAKRPKQYKLVVVGDGACGKTCLLTVFTKNEFPVDHIPTVFDTSAADLEVAGHKVRLELWDTAGQEDYDRLRPLSYPNTNILLLVFSIDNPDSFVNARDKWFPEIQRYCHGLPIILVGTKKDLRADADAINRLSVHGQVTLKADQGKKLAEEIRAQAYMECSSKRNEGVREVFDAAARLLLAKEKKSRCTLL